MIPADAIIVTEDDSIRELFSLMRLLVIDNKDDNTCTTNHMETYRKTCNQQQTNKTGKTEETKQFRSQTRRLIVEDSFILQFVPLGTCTYSTDIIVHSAMIEDEDLTTVGTRIVVADTPGTAENNKEAAAADLVDATTDHLMIDFANNV